MCLKLPSNVDDNEAVMNSYELFLLLQMYNNTTNLLNPMLMTQHAVVENQRDKRPGISNIIVYKYFLQKKKAVIIYKCPSSTNYFLLNLS